MASSRDLAIHEGRAEDLLPRLAAASDAKRVLVPASPDPAIRAAVAALHRAAPDVEVTVVEDTPFVSLMNEPDLGRFFRYWNKAKKSALRPQGV